ncbi:hypothetical protein TEPIDINF_000204 [Tepidibacillus infernus]
MDKALELFRMLVNAHDVERFIRDRSRAYLLKDFSNFIRPIEAEKYIKE